MSGLGGWAMHQRPDGTGWCERRALVDCPACGWINTVLADELRTAVTPRQPDLSFLDRDS